MNMNETEILTNGERAIPENFRGLEDYLIYLRSLFAYDVVRKYITKKSLILEIGSGEGYGTSYLSRFVKNIIVLKGGMNSKEREKINEGSRSVVYRAVRDSDSEPVIIKTLKSEYPTRKDIIRIRHGYEILSKLNLAGVPKVCGLERHNNGLAQILEYFEGMTLKDHIKSSNIGLGEFLRSEERRVGKECRSRWSPDH